MSTNTRTRVINGRANNNDAGSTTVVSIYPAFTSTKKENDPTTTTDGPIGLEVFQAMNLELFRCFYLIDGHLFK